MKTFKQFLNEEVSQQELKGIEKYADKLFQTLGIDVAFTGHFLKRVNDKRNERQLITVAELMRLFKESYRKYGKEIAKLSHKTQAVINDMMTDLNMPFVFEYNRRSKMFDLVGKTVMRKKNFKTADRKFTI